MKLIFEEIYLGHRIISKGIEVFIKFIIVWTVASFISVFEVLIDHRINIDPWSFPMIMSPA